MIEAEIICDSLARNSGIRLTTFRLRYPKFIHGELMTHRIFSRNASSSRAIPTNKYLEEVRSDELRAKPVSWGKNQAGMQAGQELSGQALLDVQLLWEQAALAASNYAEMMAKVGAHKQTVNRVMEPYVHINVLVTATSFLNFFGLRLHKDAMPEIRALANEMWDVYNDPKPLILRQGQWHLPFIYRSISGDDLLYHADDESGPIALSDAVKVSVARCARVSYRSYDTGKLSTFEEDTMLYRRLMGAHPVHASPAEHQATPDQWSYVGQMERAWKHRQYHGNFEGWEQYRKMIDGEACAPLPEGYLYNAPKVD